MSEPKFMVFNLKDLKVSLIVIAAVIASIIIFITFNNNKVTTFAPVSNYEDGTYFANIAFSDANIDLVVDVSNNLISSVSLQNFDAEERAKYEDLNNSISFVNDYVTATQTTELPDTTNFSVGTSLLMDAVSIALSENDNATLVSSYQVPLLQQISPEVAVEEDNMIEDTLTEDAIEEDLAEPALP